MVGLPPVVTGLGAVVEQLSEGREGDSGLSDQFASWRATFAGWQQSLLDATATVATRSDGRVDEVRPPLPTGQDQDDSSPQRLRPMAPSSGSPSGRAPRNRAGADATPTHSAHASRSSDNDDDGPMRGGLLPPLPGTMP